MPNVEVFGSANCPFSRAARRLLDRKGVEYAYRSVDDAPEVRSDMTDRCGESTVPQIFIGGRHIGGFDDLAELEADERLDEMLA